MTDDVKEELHYDEAEDKLIVHREQDVEPYIERAHGLADIENAKRNRDMYYAGTIPAVIVEAFCKKRGVTFHEFMVDRSLMRELLNDRDLSRLRIWKGRV